MEWQPIETAPKDGSPVTVKRVYQDRVIYEGPAVWRTVVFEPLYDPVSGECYSDGGPATGWMRTDSDYRVPTPTHWMPPPTPRAGEGRTG